MKRLQIVLGLGLAAVSLQAGEWQPVAGQLMTRWAAEVSPDNPLPEYPRPQLVRREWTNLNGLWDYSIQSLAAIAPASYDGKILVPYPLEAALSGVRKVLAPTDRLWYQRTFDAPDLAGRQRLLLHFGAADWETRVWVNGTLAGEHRGGYDPFTFDITETVKAGASNELTVAVSDPGITAFQPDGKQNYKKFTKPGGIAYTSSSGIWQTVWLETVPTAYIRDLKITPDLLAGVVRVRVAASRAATDAMVEVTALDGDKEVGKISGKSGTELVVPVPNARCWTPDDPFLYGLKVRLGVDEVTSYFGMRGIALGKDDKGLPRILLNGKVVFQAGPLDQGFWPDGLYTAPTDAALRFDIEEMKRLGFNMVRKHLKVEPARWYYWCDKLGLLVWQDMPCADGGAAASKEQDGVVKLPEAAQGFESELKAMIETHYNHPSIIMWVIFNEGWGQYDTPRLTQSVRQLDPTRLINSTSGWHDQRVGDIVDAHNYPAPVCPPAEAVRAAVLGEFGGLGLAVPNHTWVAHAMVGRDVGDEQTLTRRYLDFWEQIRQLKDTGLCAAVYTQLTDVETECNGLLTYDRKQLKVDAKQAAAAHRRLYGPPSPRSN